MDWFANNWSSVSSLTHDLLAHLVPKDDVQQMSFAQRYARIYQYSLVDRNMDTAHQQANVEALTKIRDCVAERAPFDEFRYRRFH